MPKTTSKTETASKSKHTVGAPSQPTQGSRKGKRAWRKNVDIDEVEQGLESIRAEERVTGSALQKKADDDLFAVDVTGDDRVRRAGPRFSKSQLSSTKILAQRSAVPAVESRVTPASTKLKRKASVAHEDRARLLRMGKRKVRGPFNAVMDPTEFGAGSALLEVSEAAKASGTYNVWEEETELKNTVKPPPLSHPKSVIDVPAVEEPHQGSSYNPPVSAHQELLRSAHEIEEQRFKTAEEHKIIRDRVASARHVENEENDGFLPTGMSLDPLNEDDVELEESADGEDKVSKLPTRKTKQQRRKAEKQRVEKRSLADKLAKRRLLASVTTAKALRKSLEHIDTSRERARVEKHLLLKEKLKRGLVGQKLGRHTVKEGAVDVQLGEDLSESLRALKPEGNLFKDRFISMQNRALVEPRAPVLPRKTRVKFKESEKHAWKRFEPEL